MKKRIVIALGGNALGENLAEQMTAARGTAKAIVDLVEAGHEIVIVHGNGPQVGMIETAFETAAKADPHFPILPMSVCVALSQGYIGYDLQNTIRKELDSRRIPAPVAAIITQVEVDPADSAFLNPSKPIGGFMTEAEAEVLRSKGIPVMEDAGRGWRQVVASPKPVNIIEAETIRAMLAAGQIPIAAGGGGIPVAMQDGQYRGKSAVIDKDFSAAKLAELINADMLIILTAVEKVAVNFGKPDQKWLDTLTVAEAEQYIAENQFAKGSMLPKVQAAISFVAPHAGPPVGAGPQAARRTALITLLQKAKDGIEGKTGTIIRN
ncbi:MAG: carbamate kinase [Spirochaetaceae bacterium]|jgi:carbamate kinase|nr:carbamate kinase [Spirochaetaceae bacterium]